MIKVNFVNNGMDHFIDLKTIIFNGGEVHIKLDRAMSFYDDWTFGNEQRFEILANLENSNDVMELLLVTDAIRRAIVGKIFPINVEIPYFPYARQDRVNVSGESLSVKVMADLINSQNYNKVTIWDAHSDVTPSLINNCVVIEQSTFVRKIPNLFNTILVAPDAGAAKKIKKVSEVLNLPYILCHKDRNVENGKLDEPIVFSSHVCQKNLLIVDDICDGGRTFINLVPHLRKITDGDISLYVTHGIFSQGFGVFEKLFKKIYCPNIFTRGFDVEKCYPFVVKI